MIHLACLRGNIGYWTYYSTVMKIKDIVENNRFITVSESSELYTKNINKVLQREVDPSRIKNLKNYLIEKDERFFNSLVVAIHKGHPKWTDIDLHEKVVIDNDEIDENEIDLLASKFGILSLYGDEQVFALDGQHRLRGLRDAYKEDKSLSDREIPIIFVLHNHQKVELTRRLFTTLNKYAEKPKGAELIIIDEDDAAAINTRRLVTSHKVLSKQNAISTSKTGAITTSDNFSFTTLVTLYNINKKLYKKTKAYYQKRPPEDELDQLYERSESFWNSFFNAFPEVIKYIEGDQMAKIQDQLISRNQENGGNLILRPVGQELIANAYSYFSDKEKTMFVEKIKKVNFSLNGNNWMYIFWNEKILGKNIKVKNDILLFLLGKNQNAKALHDDVSKVYKQHNKEYKNHITPV